MIVFSRWRQRQTNVGARSLVASKIMSLFLFYNRDTMSLLVHWNNFPNLSSLVTVTSEQCPTPAMQACRKGGSEEGVEPARVIVLQIADERTRRTNRSRELG